MSPLEQGVLTTYLDLKSNNLPNQLLKTKKHLLVKSPLVSLSLAVNLRLTRLIMSLI
jgi:hypothetical protein